ncbi:hypothetical protein [Knoellia sp. p5-6-4]|uniref:hypothetical protein n=1 Tax=unclassified Knoellia TaxID=2618719 RepID=UPI0023DC1CA5|nr:hypothetical protein [Knoellia sp. p5-6-4]MDF2146376.1 hypothetical protein [Knoellia sp. p5-6-4]
MPSSSVDPERLLGLGATLESLRSVARAGAEEVLGHFPEVGDRPTQNALDGLLEQLADTLRAVDAEATELAGRLRIAATSQRATALPAAPVTDDVSAPPKGLFR